jgi:hypothetical protein
MASPLRDEVESNFNAFEKQWPSDLSNAQAALAGSRKKFVDSYLRISTIQAWRTSVILGNVSEGAEAFFFEAQNDFLISHCLSRCGSFRQALKALRGAIENLYFSLYYKDHPVELAKWRDGRYKIGFSDLNSYFGSHPSVCNNDQALQSLATIKDEYATLSKAVHGSAVAFRMTKNLTEINLWGSDAASVGKWATREAHVIVPVNVLLCHLFAEKLQGASNRNLREMIGLVTSKAQQKVMKERLGITFPAA